jgi:hypothetical protein
LLEVELQIESYHALAQAAIRGARARKIGRKAGARAVAALIDSAMGIR